MAPGLNPDQNLPLYLQNDSCRILASHMFLSLLILPGVFVWTIDQMSLYAEGLFPLTLKCLIAKLCIRYPTLGASALSHEACGEQEQCLFSGGTSKPSVCGGKWLNSALPFCTQPQWIATACTHHLPFTDRTHGLLLLLHIIFFPFVFKLKCFVSREPPVAPFHVFPCLVMTFSRPALAWSFGKDLYMSYGWGPHFFFLL